MQELRALCEGKYKVKQVLGTSPDSALLAAELGLPYAVALFINPQFDPRIVEAYRSRFRPSPLQPEPRVMIAMNAFCADAQHVFSPEEHAFVQGVSRVRAVGTPQTIRVRVTQLATQFHADEVMAVCNSFHFSDRLRSFELLAQAFAVPATAV